MKRKCTVLITMVLSAAMLFTGCRHVFDTVFDLCKQNEDAMFRNRNKEPIRGTYILKFGILEGLYYEFTINEYSTIKVDAHNGQVIMKNFWDGVYVD